MDQGHYHLLREQVQYVLRPAKNKPQQQQKIWTIKIQKISNISRMNFFLSRAFRLSLFNLNFKWNHLNSKHTLPHTKSLAFLCIVQFGRLLLSQETKTTTTKAHAINTCLHIFSMIDWMVCWLCKWVCVWVCLFTLTELYFYRVERSS